MQIIVVDKRLARARTLTFTRRHALIVFSAVVLVVPPTLAVIIAAIVAGGAFLATVREWWRMPVWAFIGAYTGTQLFIVVDPAPLTLLLALAILIYLGLDWIGRGESQSIRARKHKAGTLFMSYLQVKERLAAQSQGGSLNVLGIGAIP